MRTIDTSKLKLNAASMVLDLGCGSGRHAHAVSHDFGNHTIGVDIQNDSLEQGKTGWEDFTKDTEIPGRVSFVKGSIYDLPFPDRSADAVICSEVMEHLIDYPEAIREFFRVLKPGGILAVSVPRFFPEQVCWWLDDNYHREEGGHIRIFDRYSLQKEIEHHTFEYISKHHAHGLHSPFWWLKCLIGVDKADKKILVKAAHSVLVSAITHKGIAFHIDKWLAPLMGKSVVMYFRKPIH